ncbi:MAG: negative transcriptional regulator [Paucimonas sp.]|nr:negative transcriptional regulator [Paucimonas sp.]
MYIPAHFEVDDPALLLEVMQTHTFATLVTTDAGLPFATPLPLLARREGEAFIIEGHMARANPQWQAFERGATALAIFHGPHAYISPTLYTSDERVPTWNYVNVQASGKVHTEHDPQRKRATLERLVAHHEASYQSQFDGIRAELVEGMLKAIVAFEMRVEKIEGKFKLNQHRLPDYRPGVQAQHESGGSDEQQMAYWLKRLGYWQ